ncbi:MAG: hypothetical protein IJ027_06530 [Oscillospiraceae bacterium]|nr:hypothetical protein [Oscillospiraceae bacterium]
MEAQKSRLSMQEFLAINEKYMEYKKSVEKKDTRNTVLGVLLSLVIVAISIYIGVVTFDIIITLGVLVVLMVVFIAFAVSNEKKTKQELEKYGSRLYQKYLKENDFI